MLKLLEISTSLFRNPSEVIEIILPLHHLIPHKFTYMLISALLGFLVWLIKPKRIWAAMVRTGNYIRRVTFSDP
ncbi:MAG: hypothetical protein SOW30_07370, partial [Parabacteroides sp.]|nr:hypothetical protein [Parabacteroides sp.]